MYLFRLDDASEYMDVEKWGKVESVLDRHAVKPLVGIIPNNEDQSLVGKYQKDSAFWEKAVKWQKKGWRIALHGYNHAYATKEGGINPVNKKSEFAGLPLEQQKEKIKSGYNILCAKGLKPDVFFAPSHTFDENTIEALRTETDIRIISDTIANDVYKENGFYFIPQQSGRPRKLPFRVTTICVHPNTMNDNGFEELEHFIAENQADVVSASGIKLRDNGMTACDKALRFMYFGMKKIKGLLA